MSDALTAKTVTIPEAVLDNEHYTGTTSAFSSPSLSNFSHTNLVPHEQKLRDIPEMPQLPFGAPRDLPSSPRHATRSPVSVLNDDVPDLDYTDDTSSMTRPHGDDPTSYDLGPPPPSDVQEDVEHLAIQFFSTHHLNAILRDQRYSRRFASFLTLYKPHLLPSLTSYLDVQKALAAFEYANVIAASIKAPPSSSTALAELKKDLGAKANDSLRILVDEALPAYLTHRLVRIVTDTLVKEVTGQNTPLMRDMIPSLAEVYCVTDPSLPDNPIVYASEEFFSTSQYGKSYVIGRNCRFLQGPQTLEMSVRRLIAALRDGKEVTETILNYRRDGSPFLNLLMIAPLYDNKGAVRYFLGAQIDVTSFVERGRGFDSFEKLLFADRADSKLGHRPSRGPTDILAELGAMLNNDELSIIRHVTARGSEGSRSSTPPPRTTKNGRRLLGMDDTNPADQNLWPQRSLGPSGRLPGVYQNYMLVRPFPSLRITFTSPALRIPGLLQTKFMERISGPAHVREGIIDAMSQGTSVTAKVNWLPPSTGRAGQSAQPRQRWIHCTPLLGADDKVGVWMVVMVEREDVTGRLHGGRVSDEADQSDGGGAGPSGGGLPAKGFTSEKLYQEYLTRQGREGVVGSFSRSSSKRDA